MDDDPRPSGLLATLQAHPVITATIVGSTVLGIIIGLVFLPEGWTLARKIAGGAIGGAGCGLIVTAPRIIG
jgi:hypothetical protein